MWDSFMAGVAISIMSKPDNYNGENEFAEMEYMNITVVTSNKPYGVSDGSNPLIDGLKVPKFNIQKDGVHSGHIQQGLRDPLCFVKNGKGKCQVAVFFYKLSISFAENIKYVSNYFVKFDNEIVRDIFYFYNNEC